jgi:16S rRNA (cytidine1402-2'-O)-methyltransferase
MTLYLVATPIGNLEDITLRAINILKTVDLIAAEDTRHSKKLLQHYQINTPVISYYQHNHQSRLPELITILTQNKTIALITDAGIPAISDPGNELVKACIQAKIQITPIPGANAALTALIASGLSTNRFTFEGFLPTKNKLRNEHLNLLAKETGTMIFYEAPHRLQKSLIDFQDTFGKDRQIVLARELTKLYEEFWRGTIGEAIAYYQDINKPKGEYTIVIQGCQESTKLELSETEIKAKLENLVQQGMSKTEASRHLAKYTSLSKREIYKLMIEIVEKHREKDS